MKRGRAAFACALLLAAPLLAGPVPLPDLDLSAQDAAFESLRRLQARSGRLFPGQTFPQSLHSLRGFTESKALSRFDSAVLLGRFPFEDRSLLRWSDTVRGNSFFLSPVLHAAVSGSAAGDTLGSGGLVGLGARIYGTLGGNLTWYTHATVNTEQVETPRFTHQFNPEFGETYSVEKGAGDSLLDMRTFNRFEYYLRYDRDWWSLKAGRDWIHSGPGYFSSLTASRETPPYYQLEARIDFAPWLKLDNYLIKMTDASYDVQKYANLHRLEFRPTASLSLAYEDIVIYQDRDPDPAYLLPFVPLTFSEANSGGRDNAAMAFDATWAAPKGVTVWGQLFLDDLLGPGSFFDDFWENRWAGLAGFQWVLPLSWADADVVAEYSHVEPWTYNGRESHTSFKHYNVPSASKLGPDSRSMDVQATWRFLKRVQLREHWEWDEKGTGRPGTLGAIHDDGVDGLTKEWLADARSAWRSTQEITVYCGRYAEARGWWTETWGAGEGRRFGGDLRIGW